DDLKLDDLDIPEIIRLLLVSDELFLNELMNFIVDYMLSKRIESLKQYVNNIFEIENGHLAFKRLKKFYTNIIDWEPEVVFRAKDFTKTSKDLLIDLLKRDYLNMNEIEIWDHIIKWGFLTIYIRKI
ncbi:844_t:CDS:1, partial [Entrophospora sp. SA101]